MRRYSKPVFTAILFLMSCAALGASEIDCALPDKPNHTFTVTGDWGVYTWDDHGIKRSWTLQCTKQQGGFAACHRWERYGENGRSVMIFRMLPDGTLIEAYSWGLLDISKIIVTSGYTCTNSGE